MRLQRFALVFGHVWMRLGAAFMFLFAAADLFAKAGRGGLSPLRKDPPPRGATAGSRNGLHARVGPIMGFVCTFIQVHFSGVNLRQGTRCPRRGLGGWGRLSGETFLPGGVCISRARQKNRGKRGQRGEIFRNTREIFSGHSECPVRNLSGKIPEERKTI